MQAGENDIVKYPRQSIAFITSILLSRFKIQTLHMYVLQYDIPTFIIFVKKKKWKDYYITINSFLLHLLKEIPTRTL